MNHFDISGKDKSEEQLPKVNPNEFTFLIFHFDMSGIEINEEHFKKMHSRLITLLTSHLDISGTSRKNKSHI